MRDRTRLRFRLQGERCYLCGRNMTLPYRTIMRDLDATTDHVLPRAAGGTGLNNKALAHYKCNNAKQDRKPYPCEIFFVVVLEEMCNSVSEAGDTKRITRMIPRRKGEDEIKWRTPEIERLYPPALALAMQEALEKKFRGGQT